MYDGFDFIINISHFIPKTIPFINTLFYNKFNTVYESCVIKNYLIKNRKDLYVEFLLKIRLALIFSNVFYITLVNINYGIRKIF